MRKFILNVLLCLMSLSLAGCGWFHKPIGDTGSLEGLKDMAKVTPPSSNSAKKANTGKIRQMALRETALSLGAQAGLAWRAKLIDDALVKQTRHLDSIYDFNALVLEHNVLPPVLVEGRKTLNLADAQTIRISDRTYKVAKQARFVTTAPDWRQYLWLDYKKPEYPHPSLLPKTREEREVWCTFVEKGWRNGVDQANIILEENIARIREDFTGMILYRKLLSMNMVSPPYVSHTDLGVTGDTEEMHIDDRVLRITALPALNINSEQWRAAVAKDEHRIHALTELEQRIKDDHLVISSHEWQPTISPVN
jgi:defect-in-organelle-trafficking protein DotC